MKKEFDPVTGQTNFANRCIDVASPFGVFFQSGTIGETVIVAPSPFVKLYPAETIQAAPFAPCWQYAYAPLVHV